MNTPETFISVIACTHRRPQSLDMLLDSLTRQSWNGGGWELIVVENDTEPSPELADVVKKYERILPIRLCLEPIPNLSRARNLGMQEARGRYLAYLDDDDEALIGWLEALMVGCREYAPDFCGGPIYPLYRSPKPYWFKDEWGIHCYYGDVPVKTDKPFAGGNFVVKRELAGSLGGFREYLGMAGDKIAYGEETDLMMRAKDSNPDLTVVYLPEVAVRHEIRPEKMTMRWCLRSAWARGRDGVTMGMGMEWLGSWSGIIRVALHAVKRMILCLPRLIVLAVADIFRPGRSVWRRHVRERVADCIGEFSGAMRAAELRLKR